MRCDLSSLRRLCGAWALAALASAAPGFAQPAASIPLAEAIRLTVERSPAIASAREEITRREGSRREATGAFDSIFRVSPYLEHAEGYLTPTTRAREDRRRIQLLESAKVFTQVRETLETYIGDGRGDLPPCPAGLTRVVVTVEGQALPMPVCRPLTPDRVTDDPELDPYALMDDANQWIPTQRSLDPGAMLAFQTSLARVLGMQIGSFTEDLRQRGIEYLKMVYRITYETETKLWLALERLGVYPTYEIRKSAGIDVSLVKPLRSGLVLQGVVHIEGVEDNYRGKPLDPVFGGKEGYPNTFRNSFAVAFTQPLRRGQGRTTVEAPVRAAERSAEAARRQYEYTVASQTLGTVLAYVDVVAVESTIALLRDSLESQLRLKDATVKLVKAGDVARSEITRTDARLAEVQASLAAAESQLAETRVTLVERIGLGAEAATATFGAGQRFAEMAAEIDVDGPAREAAARRADFRAATALTEASRLLLESARANTRSRLDLTVRVGMASDYFGPYFRVLKDEFKREPKEPTARPAEYFNPRGTWRSFTDNLQPQAYAKLTWELPFGNNAQLGRLAQAQSTLHRSQIQAADLARTIDENVLRLAGSVRKARQELERWREAVGQYEETWKSTERLRVAGSLSLVDTLQTEQDLTAARQQYVQAQREYASTVARFKFETGTLVEYRDGTAVVADLSALIAPR